jgi:hypothetical protein
LACNLTPILDLTLLLLLAPLLLLLLLLLLQLWEAALRVGADAMLAGMGQVRKCSQQGRAAMSLDLSAVEKGLRPLAPATALSSLRRVGLQPNWVMLCMLAACMVLFGLCTFSCQLSLGMSIATAGIC